MSIRYKKSQNLQKSSIRGKDAKIAKRTEKEKKMPIKNLKRRQKLVKNTEDSDT